MMFNWTMHWVVLCICHMLLFSVSLLTGDLSDCEVVILFLLKMPMWSCRICDVLAVVVSVQLKKTRILFVFWWNVKPLVVNGFAKKGRKKKPTTHFYCPLLFPCQTSWILHYHAFSVMQTLNFVFYFYYNLLLYRIYSVKSIDLYQNYLSDKILIHLSVLKWFNLLGLYVCECWSTNNTSMCT